MIYDDEADAFDLAEDAELAQTLDKAAAKIASRKVGDERFHDVFAVSDPDEDSDGDGAPQLPKSLRQNDSDIEDEEGANPDDHDGLGNWGKKKKHFYGGNPNEKARGGKGKDEVKDGDLDEAEAEAEESKAIQLKQLQELDEEDFFDTFGGDPDLQKKDEKLGSSGQAAASAGDEIELDLSKLSKKEKRELFHRENPEFKGIIEDFEAKVEEASKRLQPILDLINTGALPDNNQAANYVRTKHQLILNYCTNVSAYLMFKTKRTNLKFHPITSRLVQFKQLLDKMAPLDEAMAPQMDKILKVAEKHKDDAKQITKSLKKMAIKHNATVSKAEKPKAEKEETKKKSKKRKLLSILSEGTPPLSPEIPPESKESLTFDEVKALELYDALKSKKAKLGPQADGDASTDSEDDKAEAEKAEKESQQPLDGEEEGDERRGITYQIAKNKGLQPKRSKLQRNPRVKHRHKFEKAKIKRKGQVREVRKETKKYAGELSGINARVKKGVKIM